MSRRASLTAGFDRLTLNPSSRLRRMRRQVEQESMTSKAWNDTGEALSRAVKTAKRNKPTPGK